MVVERLTMPGIIGGIGINSGFVSIRLVFALGNDMASP